MTVATIFTDEVHALQGHAPRIHFRDGHPVAMSCTCGWLPTGQFDLDSDTEYVLHVCTADLARLASSRIPSGHVDQSRIHARESALRESAQQLHRLGAIPERATTADLTRAADLMIQAAADLRRLTRVELVGCVCRRIEGDNSSYLDYEVNCQHRRALALHRESLKADYAKLEKALKNEARMKLVAAALSGTATLVISPDLVKRAIAIADEVIRQVTEEGA